LRTRFTPLFPALFLLAPAPRPITAAEGPARDLDTYIQVFLKSDPRLGISQAALKVSRIEESRAGDTTASHFTYSPAYTYTRDRGLGGSSSLDDRYLSQSLGYTRITRAGTALDAEAGHNNDSSTIYGAKQDAYSAKLSLSKPLLQNRSGRLRTLDQRAKGLSRESAERAHEDAALARRLAAAELFTRAYTAEKKVEVFAELLENMRRVWEQTREDYAKKLIAKLDYLSVQSNWYEMRGTHARIEAERRQRFQQLNLYTPSAWTAGLASPGPYFDARPVPEEPDFSAHPSVQAAARKADALRAQNTFIAERGADELSLDASAGYTHTSNPLSYSPRDKDAWKAKAGFRYAFGGLDPATSHDLQANEARVESALLEKEEALRILKEAWRLRRTEHDEAAELLRLNEEKLAVYENQIAEAFRKFKQGRLEFQDYLQHWDRFENAKLSGLDLRQKLWSARLDLLRIAGDAAR